MRFPAFGPKSVNRKRLLNLVFCGLFLVVLVAGCAERPADQPTAAAPEPAGEQRDALTDTARDTAPRAPAEPVTAETPVPMEFPDGPTVEEKHPNLATASLVHARLVDDLPEGVVLQASGLVVTKDDIEQQMAQSPPEVREQLSKSGFFLLEQVVTQDLLAHEARQHLGSGDERTLLQSYLREVAGTSSVSDAEVEAFYKENREMVGSAPLTQAKEQIRQHLMQEKQQKAVDRHIRTIGERVPIAVAADWVAQQAELSRDNPVDRARASGRPTIASFGADSCIPCQMMVPTREAVREKYEGKANVVYVHVGNAQVLASRYGVRGIPLLIFFDADGEEFHRHTGVMSQEEIEAYLAQMGVQG